MTAIFGRALSGAARFVLLVAVALGLAACGGARSAKGTDIAVSGSGPSDPIATGGTVVFTMTVQNIGINAAIDVKLVNALGNFLNAPSIECQASRGAVCPAAPGFTMTIPSIPVGGRLDFKVTAGIVATSSVTVTNTMSATVADDVNRLDNAYTATAQVTATNSDLVVGGSGPAATVAGGASAEFVMTVGNVGTDAATNVKIVEQVGSNLALTAITCSAGGGAVCPATPGVVMTLDSIPAGGTLSFTVQVVVGPGISGTIVNTLSATADNDRVRDNNSFVATGNAFSAKSGVAVTGTPPAAAVPAGTSASFAMSVANAGPDEATDVKITNTVGGNLTLQSIACSATGGATCPATPGVSMTVPALPAGGSLNFVVTAFVAVGTNGSITNTMVANPGSSDPDRGDNSAVAAGSAYANNVSVSASGPGTPVAGGASTAVTVVVTNTGPGTAFDVDMTNVPGTGLAPAGPIACVASGGAVCPATPAATMRAPTIPLNGSLSFTIPLGVTAGANGNLLDTFSATTAGDTRAADNSGTAVVAAVSADLGLSMQGSATVAAGSNADFRVVVANPGPGTAANLAIHWVATAPFTPGAVSVTCTPTGGATCPATLGADMTLASLGPQRSLSFVFSLPVPADGRGALVGTASVTADGDPDATNNSASVTTVAQDPRSGLYRAYAADGRGYDLTIDFDAGLYTMAGNGASETRSFAADAGGGYTVGGNERLRSAADLVVGGHAFGGSVVLPYVAARRFQTSVASIGGVFNLMTRNVNADGSIPVTRAGTARISGNVLQVCQDDIEVVQVQLCSAAAVRSYLLGVSGDVFSATDTAGGPGFTFRVARTGAADVLLAAGNSTAGDSTLQWRIGLAESAGLIGGTVFGPGVYAGGGSDWLTTVLTNTTWAALGSAINDVSGLFRADSGSPVAMLQGASDGVLGLAPIWVMQSFPLVVVIGATTSGFGLPNASGLLQIGVP